MWDRPDMLNPIASVLFAAALLAAAYGMVQFVIRLPVFPLREVHVEGKLSHVTMDQVESTVKRSVNGNFFTVDLIGMREAFEKLPWVRSVSARREWPDRISVALDEHVPLARWGNSALVDTDGELFTAAYDGKLPLFDGPEESVKEIAIQYGYFQRVLSAIALVPAEIHLSPRRAWQIRLDNGLRVELGRENIEPRLERFIAYYGRTLKPLQRKLDYVDLRYSNGFAVRVPGLKPDPRDKSSATAGTKRG